jgi:small-conductance mechanosensitive channel
MSLIDNLSRQPAPSFDLDEVVSRLLDKVYGLLTALPTFLLALLVVWVGWKLGGWLSRRTAIERLSARNPFVKELARTTARWVSTSIALLIALEILDATAVVGAMLGTAGVIGIALGFAFKETLENYLAGVLMSLRQPFAPRDLVVIDGHEGTVVALTSRATILMTPDGNHLRLPNALVFRSVMLNYTRNPSRRFEFDVGVGVQEDLIQAQVIGTEELQRLAGVMPNPPPRALIQTLGDSNVQLRFRGWVDQRTHDFWTVRSEAIRVVKLSLEAAGMDMPEPIYRVQLSEPLVATHTTPARSDADTPKRARRTERGAPVPEVDLGVNHELRQQIDQDRQASDQPNLLDPQAPRE